MSSPGSTTPHAAPTDASTSSARRVAIACGVGTAIERYDFFIYGTAAATVFAPQFFPQVSDLAGRIAALATFAIGLIALPVGGIVMGHFGDRRGRKAMLVWSLMLMGLSTFAIGLLPTYASIGIAAPLLLVALRFVQGLALGGEWGGAALMAVEHAPGSHRGLFGSLVALGIPAGLILANVVFFIASVSVSAEDFAAWGWRLPFLASAALVLLGLYVRIGIAESPVFANLLDRRAERDAPVRDLVRDHWRTVLLAAGSHMSSAALGYVAIVFFVSYATRELGLPLPTMLALLVVSSVAFAVSIVMCAHWSDRWGRRRVMVAGLSALGLWSVVFFPLADTRSVPLVGVALTVMMILQGPYMGAQPAVFSELFPATVRYSGASLSQTLGNILGGALTPIVATTLFDITRTSWSITAYLATLSLISWLCCLRLQETYRRPLAHDAQPHR